MLSVYRFFEIEFFITSFCLFFRLIDKIIDDRYYQQEPDLHQLTHLRENPQLQVIANLLIQFKDELSFETANQYQRLKFISDQSAPAVSIARMRFWSRQEEYIILLSENLLTAKLPKTEVRTLLSIAIAHLVCGHYQRRHEALMFIKDMTPIWIFFAISCNIFEMSLKTSNWPFHLSSSIFVISSLVLNKTLSIYFKKMDREADFYAIEHLGVQQDELAHAISQIGHQQASGFFSMHQSSQERQNYIKKMS